MRKGNDRRFRLETELKKRPWRRLPLLLSLWIFFQMVFAGCFRLGPDYQRPDLGISVPGTYQNVSPVNASLPELSDRWWTEFEDFELNRVVDSVLANNQDIRAASARILELRALARSARADRFPTLDIDGEWSRRESYVGEGSNAERIITRSYGLSLPAFFEIDLWGRLARAEEAAVASLLAAEENRLAVAQTVVAEAVRLYFEIESVERRISIAELLIDNFRRNLNLVERRYRLGLANVLDVRQARRILAEAEAQIPALRRDLGSFQQELGVLMGVYPENRAARVHPEAYYQQLAEIPAGVPSDLLRRRPDIRSAEAQLRSLNARVGEALANRFPRISLTGSLGLRTGEANLFFDKESRFWEIASGFTQPLFDAGGLKAEQEAAEARFSQAVSEYIQTVLTAFAEVERALLTRREEILRRERLVSFLKEARKTQSAAENRYARGLTGYLDVLDAQAARFRAEENVVEVDLALIVNRVNLYLSIGGSWGALPAADVNIPKGTSADDLATAASNPTTME